MNPPEQADYLTLQSWCLNPRKPDGANISTRLSRVLRQKKHPVAVFFANRRDGFAGSHEGNRRRLSEIKATYGQLQTCVAGDRP